MYPNWRDRHFREEPPDWTDTMQVCESGHKITEYAVSQPESTKKRCPDCGAPTLTACPKCQKSIPGHRHMSGIVYMSQKDPPAFCHECGEAFPWKDKLPAILEAKAQKAAGKKGGKKASGGGEGGTTNVYHGPVIQGRDFVNSPIQQASPHGSQTVSFSADQTAVAKDAIRLVLEVLNELDLAPAERDEVRADAESAKTQLESPKPKVGVVKALLTGVRDTITKAISGKVGEYIVTKAQPAVDGMTAFLNSIGG